MTGLQPGSTATGARTRILASAGTGKTFRLTSHFLALLFAGAEPERILATTFTRKASGEILERLLLRLARAVSDDAALVELRTATGTADLDAARCRAELRRVVFHLHRFQVRTLDSFFVRVATLFGLELGLPPGWSIASETEGDELRAEAVDRLLANCEPEPLVELLRGLQANPANRDVHATLVKLLGAGRIALLDGREEAACWLPVPKAPDPADFDDALEALARQPLPTRKKDGKPDAIWQKAVDGILRNGRREDWDGLLGNGLVKKALTGETTFSGKEISEDVYPLLRVVVDRVAHEHLARLDRRNRSMKHLLDELGTHYDALLRERGKLRFEDVPALLDPRDGEPNIAPDDMWFRLDGQLDHLLLDEFQDTSASQWRVLAPLASEIVAEAESARSFFCVGDVKQCIYYWRQAEPRLFKQMDAMLPGLAPAESLNRSFRSAPVVLDTVNRIFTNLPQRSVFKEKATRGLEDAVESWSEGFGVHAAHHEGMPGGALMIEAPAREPEDGGEPTPPDPIEMAADRISLLLERHPEASVGVLFRTNAPIPRMMMLLSDRRLRASGEGGNLLTDSIATLHFLALLTLADHPAHALAAFAVETSPFGPAVGMSPGEHADAAKRSAIATRIRKRLATEGYGGFTASFTALVDAEYRDWDTRRFQQLVDLAEAWSEPDALRPGQLVAHVLRTRVEDPTASNIQCMTVHAAKGLEFDAVFLPELSGDLVQAPRDLLTHRARADGLLDAICIKPTEPIAALSPDLSEMLRAGKARALEEALSVLYVATTRARHWVEMIVPEVMPRQPKASAAHLLREALGAKPADASNVVWRHPDTDDETSWPCDGARSAEPEGDASAAPTEPAPAPAPLVGLGLRAATAPRFPATRSPSSAGDNRTRGARGRSAADLLRAPARRALQRGTLVHRLAQEVEWLDDFTASDADLAALLEPLEPDTDERRQAVEQFLAAIAHPQVAALLARPVDGVAREVIRERRFSVELDEGDDTTTLWNGAIDRLVLEQRDGNIVAAWVVDWKSDAVDAVEAERRSEDYRAQMETYRRVVAAQTGLAESAIRLSLAFLSPGFVLEL